MNIGAWPLAEALTGADEGEEVRLGLYFFFFGLALLAFGLWLIVRWPRFWRGEYKKVGAQLAIFGPRWGRVGLSLYPAVSILPIAVGCMMITGYLSEALSGTLQRYAEFAVNVFVGFVLASLPLYALLILFNRPRFLIPPYARDFHGLFGDWVITVYRRLRKKPALESPVRNASGDEPPRRHRRGPGRHARPWE